MLEEFRQVTLGLELASAQLRGEKLTGPGVAAHRKADADKPKTRASVVSDMEAAIAISYPLVEKSPNPLLIGWIEDQAPGRHEAPLQDNGGGSHPELPRYSSAVGTRDSQDRPSHRA